MSLEVQIEKRLPSYTLSVEFIAGPRPLAILGPSGAGKTMTLRCIAGLVRPDRGRIVLNDRVLFDSSKKIDVPSRERRIGLLFQNYALFPHMTVAENIAFSLDRASPDERKRSVREKLGALQLGDLGNRLPRQLSGGEQQRTAFARALALEPAALLLDEPLSALDTHLRYQIEHLLQETLASYKGPALLVTHNIEEAYRLGEEMLVLTKGRIAAFGPKGGVFRHPPSLEVARLTGCKNFSRAQLISGNMIDATDWGCRLRISSGFTKSVAHVGIRAHLIQFVESSDGGASDDNTFPCWLTDASETPFRITLYLKLHSAPRPGEPPQLQAEVFKEKWERFKDRPMPWRVRLAPEVLMVLPD